MSTSRNQNETRQQATELLIGIQLIGGTAALEVLRDRIAAALAEAQQARAAIEKIKARLPKRIPAGEPLGECLIDIALIVSAARGSWGQ